MAVRSATQTKEIKINFMGLLFTIIQLKCSYSVSKNTINYVVLTSRNDPDYSQAFCGSNFNIKDCSSTLTRSFMIESSAEVQTMDKTGQRDRRI